MFSDERETKPTEDGVPAPEATPEFGTLPLPGVDSPVWGVSGVRVPASDVEEAECVTGGRSKLVERSYVPFASSPVAWPSPAAAAVESELTGV